MMKKNKRTSKVTKLTTSTPVIKTKPFTNLPKPSFISFGQLYLLIETRLGKERNENARRIDWILEKKDFNDEQLIGFLLLQMLFFKKRLKTVDKQKTGEKELSYEDFIAREVISERSIFSLLSEKQQAETLLNDEQLFQLVLADQPFTEKIFKMTFDYIPENPLLKRSRERALPADAQIAPPTEPPDDALIMIKAALDEVKNLLDKPRIYPDQLRRTKQILTETEQLVYRMRKDVPKKTINLPLEYLLHSLLDKLQELIDRLSHKELYLDEVYGEKAVYRNDLKILERLNLQIHANLDDKQQSDHQSSSDT